MDADRTSGRKLNPVVAWLLVSFKFMWVAIRYGSSVDAELNYTTGKVTVLRRRQ